MRLEDIHDIMQNVGILFTSYVLSDEGYVSIMKALNGLEDIWWDEQDGLPWIPQSWENSL